MKGLVMTLLLAGLVLTTASPTVAEDRSAMLPQNLMLLESRQAEVIEGRRATLDRIGRLEILEERVRSAISQVQSEHESATGIAEAMDKLTNLLDGISLPQDSPVEEGSLARINSMVNQVEQQARRVLDATYHYSALQQLEYELAQRDPSSMSSDYRYSEFARSLGAMIRPFFFESRPTAIEELASGNLRRQFFGHLWDERSEIKLLDRFVGLEPARAVLEQIRRDVSQERSRYSVEAIRSRLEGLERNLMYPAKLSISYRVFDGVH